MEDGRKQRIRVALGIFLFSLGTLVGLVLALFMNWADLESRLFDPSLSGESVLRLRCPVLMGRDELVHVSASFRNPLERDVRYVIRAHVSEGHVLLMRQLDTQLPLPPGESERLEWEVTPADAAYGLFALVKVHQFRLYPLPGRQGSCGVVLVDFPLPGGLMFAIALGLTVLGMGGGYLLWARANRPLSDSALQVSRAMALFAALVALGVLTGLMNIWILGVVVLAVSVLLVVVLLGSRLEKRRN